MATRNVSGINSFLREQAQYGRFRGPTLSVLLAGVAFGLQGVAIYYALGEEALDISNAITVEVAIQFGEPIALWFVLSGAFALIARMFTSRIRIGRLFKLSGWGFLPFVVTGITWALGDYLVFQDQTVPDGVQVGVLSAEREAFQLIVTRVATDPVIIATTVIGCVFILGSGYIWSLAVKYSTDLERRQSMIVAFLPTLAYIAFILLQLL